ncbi:hypothetical protein C8T65DRAFT_735733 [Cerioporus squamosus]|nr:hypothetical protein C8T65DRAFT_735733 [Cerioporus squamosus]
MARAWPRLEKLDLHHYKYNPSTSFQDNFSQLEYRATLKGLSAFAYNCPSLKILTLPIDPWCDAFYRADDAGAPGWEYDFRPVAPTRSALIGLYVGFIDPTYPEQVAAILSALFPLLDHVGHGDLDEGLYNFPGWEEVNRVLRAFKGIRGLVAGDGA